MRGYVPIEEFINKTIAESAASVNELFSRERLLFRVLFLLSSPQLFFLLQSVVVDMSKFAATMPILLLHKKEGSLEGPYRKSQEP
jgi:hypothetical protein